jgi:hypothetical protein
MKKFIVYTRAIPGCCRIGEAPSVVEVEGEMVAAVDDPSVGWLPSGEFKFKILKPEFLYETHEIKLADGSRKKITVPPVYYSHAMYWTEIQAMSVAERMVRESLEFEVRKGRVESFSPEELKAKCAEIQKVML